MATWVEALTWMMESKSHTASHDAMYMYRLNNGQTERTTWKGGNPWLPHIPSEDLVLSSGWDLHKPF